MALSAFLIVFIISGVYGMPLPDEIVTESMGVVTEAANEVAGGSVMDLVDQIAEGGMMPMEMVATAQVEEGLPSNQETSSINQVSSLPVETATIAKDVLATETAPIAQEVLKTETAPNAQGAVPLETAPIAQVVLPTETAPNAQGAVPLETAPIAQVVLPTETAPNAQGAVPLETAPNAQEVLPTETGPTAQVVLGTEKVPIVETPQPQQVDQAPINAPGELSLEKVPIVETPQPQQVDQAPINAPGELSLEKVPIVETPQPQQVDQAPISAPGELSLEKVPIVETPQPQDVDQAPISAPGELSLEKVPSGQTVEEGSKLSSVESMDNAPASEPASVVPTNPSLERLAKLLSFKNIGKTPAGLQVMESVDVDKDPNSESADKANPSLNGAEQPVNQFPMSQAMEPDSDAARNVPELDVPIQGEAFAAPAEIPSIEVNRDEPWDSVEDAREAASQLAYQQFLGIDPLTFAMSEMNTSFDENESESDRHYVKKRILQLSSEERAINQAYSENIEQREAERFRRKSLAVMRQPQI